jgi:hypothetical protein
MALGDGIVEHSRRRASSSASSSRQSTSTSRDNGLRDELRRTQDVVKEQGLMIQQLIWMVRGATGSQFGMPPVPTPFGVPPTYPCPAQTGQSDEPMTPRGDTSQVKLVLFKLEFKI